MSVGHREHVSEIESAMLGDTSTRDAAVISSWRRCIDLHKLDPANRQAPYVVSDSQLKEHRQEAEGLIHIARGGLDRLFRQVAGQRYVLLLADQHGVTVDYFGDGQFERELRRAGLYLGSDWSESLAGTSAVGACIQAGEAVTIHQDDHFDLTHTPLSCTAAPIFDTTGEFAAVLDISLLRSPRPKASQRLAMQLVCASARRVELANLMARSASEWVLRFSLSPELLDVDPDAAVTIDGSGRIIGFTHGAATALAGVAGVDWRQPAWLLGQSMTRFFNTDINELPRFMRGRPAEERVLQFVDGSPVFAHAIAPQPVSPAVRIPQTSRKSPLSDLHGGDPAMLRVQQAASRLVESIVPVFIHGEPGTGKRELARSMHASRTPNKPFLLLSCAGLTPEMIEQARPSSLATNDSGSLLARLGGGTLFLDEVSDLCATSQDTLLRLLVEFENEVLPVSRVREVPRLMSSSRVSLAGSVRDGHFREDLFHRLVGATLKLPAVRERKDFEWLLQRVLSQRCNTVPPVYRFTAAAFEALAQRDWPGNLRELANVIDVAIAVCPGATIDCEHLPESVMTLSDASVNKERTPENLAQLLDSCHWNISRVARSLGVNRSTVHRRIARAGLQRPG